MPQAPRIICLAGPTGAGKSAIALALADLLPISVINADSRQVYRDFPIITAQPSPEEQGRCPHALYGFLGCREKISAGRYAQKAGAAIAQSLAQGRLPVLVGGTGLYFKSLLQGIAEIPAVDEAISRTLLERWDAEGGQVLHRELAAIDPAYAAKIHFNDRQRVLRALEVWQGTGKTFTWWHARPLPAPAFQTLNLGLALPLDELTPILGARIRIMLKADAPGEARTALERCPDPAAPGWSGIGCRELYGYLQGEYTLEECLTLWLRNTRAYAKRQLTWFRADQSLAWFRPEESKTLLGAALRWLDS